MSQTITILFLGDVIGKPGREAVMHYVTNLKTRPDVIVANIENLAHGFGVTEKYIQDLMEVGVDVFTGGNHTFDRKELFGFIDRYECLLRPANYPDGTPGKGFCIHQAKSTKVGILNLMGRVFMEPLESPFLIADRLLPAIIGQTNLIIVDMHAEATSEKVAMGWYLNGRVSAIVGTHTHVQTADERVLSDGTAYITDVGCCGPVDGIIGMERSGVFRRLIQQLPCRFEVAPGPHMVNGVYLVLDVATGKALSITRIHQEQTSSDGS